MAVQVGQTWVLKPCHRRIMESVVLNSRSSAKLLLPMSMSTIDMQNSEKKAKNVIISGLEETDTQADRDLANNFFVCGPNFTNFFSSTCEGSWSITFISDF